MEDRNSCKKIIDHLEITKLEIEKEINILIGKKAGITQAIKVVHYVQDRDRQITGQECLDILKRAEEPTPTLSPGRRPLQGKIIKEGGCETGRCGV